MDLTEEEVDFNKVTKRLVSLEGLKKLQAKYKGVSYMEKAIEEAIKEQENE